MIPGVMGMAILLYHCSANIKRVLAHYSPRAASSNLLRACSTIPLSHGGRAPVKLGVGRKRQWPLLAALPLYPRSGRGRVLRVAVGNRAEYGSCIRCIRRTEGDAP